MKTIDYDQFDPGIRRVVWLLNQHGFVTSDSGDGSRAGVMECAVEYPMVVVQLMPGECTYGPSRVRSVFNLLRRVSRDRSIWTPQMEVPFAQVEYSYQPFYARTPGYAGTICITHFADKDLVDGAGEA